MFVPLKIVYSPTWKSAKIRFKPGSQWIPNVGVDPNSVKIGEITLDDTVQAPYTAYLPVTVTGEGRFYFEGKITIEALDGELFDNGESVWTEATNDFSVFAFKGKFFMGSSAAEDLIKRLRKYCNRMTNISRLETNVMKLKTER